MILLLLLASTLIAEPGNWRIRKETDPMTDKPDCIGFYKEKPHVQLGDRGLYVSYRGRGGVGGVIIRFDDKPAQALRLPSDIESKLSAVILNKAEFKELESAQRVRIRVSTVLNRIVDEDLDLTGTSEALEILRGSQCK